MNDRQIYAGFWQRVFAGLMDIMLVGFVTFLASVIFFPDYLMVESDMARMMRDPFADPFLFHPMHVAVTLAYYIGFYVSPWQATLGMRSMGIYITNLQGGRISIIRGLIRYAAEFLSALTFMLGYLMMIVTPKRQTLHDLIAATTVRRGVL